MMSGLFLKPDGPGRRTASCFVLPGKVEALLTIDGNLAYQQNMTGLPFGVVVLSALTNRLEDLLPLVSGILVALEALRPGQVVRVGG
jgi:hypothetical protein